MLRKKRDSLNGRRSETMAEINWKTKEEIEQEQLEKKLKEKLSTTDRLEALEEAILLLMNEV